MVVPSAHSVAEEKLWQKGCLPQSVPPLFQYRPHETVPGKKGVRSLWDQFGMHASPYAPPNVEHTLIQKEEKTGFFTKATLQ